MNEKEWNLKNIQHILSEVNNYVLCLMRSYDARGLVLSKEQEEANHEAFKEYVNDLRDRNLLPPLKAITNKTGVKDE